MMDGISLEDLHNEALIRADNERFGHLNIWSLCHNVIDKFKKSDMPVSLHGPSIYFHFRLSGSSPFSCLPINICCLLVKFVTHYHA
jgi:hypothetical protein